MFRKIKEYTFFQAVFFAVPRVFRAGPSFFMGILLAQILSALLTPATALLMGRVATVIKEMIRSASTDASILLPWIVLGATISILIAICRVATTYCTSCLSDRLTLTMQRAVVEKICSLNLELIEDRNVQDVLSRGRQAPGLSMLNFTTGFLTISTTLLRIVGLLGVLFWVSPLWAAIIVLLGIPALVGNRYLSLINFRIKREKTTARRWCNYYTSILTNRVMIPTIATLGIQDLFIERFDQTMQEINSVRGKFYRLRLAVILAITFLMTGTIVAALLTVARGASTGMVDVGRLTAFWVAAWRIQTTLSGLGKSFFTLSEFEFNIFNLQELFSLKNTLPKSGSHSPKHPLGDIDIRNLSFVYRGTTKPVLKNLSISIKQGETVAIVGPNGSGKTTLAKLIAQFYVPTQGQILIDQRPAVEYERSELFKRMSFVTQSPAQFEATAQENISFGAWKKLSKNPAAVQELARHTQVDQMIQGMPEGYHTLLGRMFGNYDISGGQRQKLALTRALACDPDLVILDEPTASLDIHTEFELYSNIKELVHGRTTILISHRFSTVRMADRIFVLNEGQITESGTHDQLIDAKGSYAAMFKLYENMSGIV